ncbi:hypothetical protein V6N11_008115 [Hibiscus sabdariffa]|uniref:UBC core domain-containing protein n=1 Tax=Hibiscus sabdariffa TaxID=183260 RepID=A0ABR2Q072_9ROSI
MATPAMERLMRDLEKLHQDPPAGSFKLTLQFPEDYPTKPPTVRFISRMFHPNISADGRIFLDILQNQWLAAYTVESILISIQSLLCDPNPNSPANEEAAKMFTENKRMFTEN